MAPPQLRGFVQKNLQRAILRSIGLGIIAGCIWKFGYADPKRRKYEEFYKNYDAEKVAEQMWVEEQARQAQAQFLPTLNTLMKAAS
ncbi:hypothetical protein pdam_00000357, partial [Pocillopora damicornis]